MVYGFATWCRTTPVAKSVGGAISFIQQAMATDLFCVDLETSPPNTALVRNGPDVETDVVLDIALVWGNSRTLEVTREVSFLQAELQQGEALRGAVRRGMTKEDLKGHRGWEALWVMLEWLRGF